MLQIRISSLYLFCIFKKSSCLLLLSRFNLNKHNKYMRIIIYFQQILYEFQILTQIRKTIVIAITLLDDYQINSRLSLSELFALQSIIPSLIILLLILRLIINLNFNLEVVQVKVQESFGHSACLSDRQERILLSQ